MRKIIIGLLLLLSVGATAQWQQTGSKVRYVNGLGIPTKDTAAGVSADSSQILIRPQDSALYIKYKRTWVKVGGGSVSGTTNYVAKFTSATALGNSQIFDNGTNVGVGTITPAYKLDVNGTILSNQYRITPSGTSVIYNVVNSDATFSGVYALQAGGGSAGFGGSILMYGHSHATKPGWITAGLSVGSNGKFSVNNQALGGGTDIFVIEQAGNVGIGYTAPAAKLAVSGTALINTNTDNGVDKLQVSGSAIATTLKFNTSGQTVSISSYYNGGTGKNLWIGGGGASSTSASIQNTSTGVDAMLNNTSGYYNAAFGTNALQFNTTGYYNSAFGNESLQSNTTGNRNICIGTQAMQSSQTGSDNFGLGSQTLVYLTTGSSNIAIGSTAGIYISGGTNLTNASQSILIGQDTRPSANGNTNEMVFGHTAIGQGSNTVTLGNSSITKTFLRGITMVNTTTDNGVDELQVNGSISGIGMKQAYVTKTGAYTATNDDYVIDCTSGTFTVTLPASSGRTGRILIIKNSGAGTITVDGNASETIDGATTYAISVQYGTIQIMSDGTNWKIIAKF